MPKVDGRRRPVAFAILVSYHVRAVGTIGNGTRTNIISSIVRAGSPLVSLETDSGDLGLQHRPARRRARPVRRRRVPPRRAEALGPPRRLADGVRRGRGPTAAAPPGGAPGPARGG